MKSTTTRAVAGVGVALTALVALTLTSLSLSLPALQALVTGAGFALVGMATMSRDALLQRDTPDDVQFKDVSNILTWRKPQNSPLYVALRNLRKGPSARQARIHWHEQDTLPRNTTKNGGSTAGNADATKQIAVNDDIYQVDDLIQLPENSNDPNAVLIVTATSSGNITVAKVDGDEDDAWGTVPAMSDGELLTRLGNAKEEFYDASPYRSSYPVEKYNFVERMDEVIGISRTRQATGDYAGDSWQQQRDNQLYDFQTSRESILFFGKRDVVTKSGDKTHFCGGIEDFGLNKVFSYSASSFDVSKLLDIVRQTFVGTNASEVRYLHCDSLMMQDIMELDQDKLRRSNYRSNLLRREIPEIQFGFGTVRLVHEQLFDEQNRSRLGYILDYEYLRIRELNPMKIVEVDLEQTQLKDGQAVQVKEEASLEFRYNDAHAKINGSS
jgi:hypothetical protein